MTRAALRTSRSRWRRSRRPSIQRLRRRSRDPGPGFLWSGGGPGAGRRAGKGGTPWIALAEAGGNREQSVGRVAAAVDIDVDSPAVQFHPRGVRSAPVGVRDDDQRGMPASLEDRGCSERACPGGRTWRLTVENARE